MDKASDFGSEDCEFESRRGQFFSLFFFFLFFFSFKKTNNWSKVWSLVAAREEGGGRGRSYWAFSKLVDRMKRVPYHGPSFLSFLFMLLYVHSSSIRLIRDGKRWGGGGARGRGGGKSGTYE